MLSHPSDDAFDANADEPATTQPQLVQVVTAAGPEISAPCALGHQENLDVIVAKAVTNQLNHLVQQLME